MNLKLSFPPCSIPTLQSTLSSHSRHSWQSRMQRAAPLPCVKTAPDVQDSYAHCLWRGAFFYMSFPQYSSSPWMANLEVSLIYAEERLCKSIRSLHINLSLIQGFLSTCYWICLISQHKAIKIIMFSVTNGKSEKSTCQTQLMASYCLLRLPCVHWYNSPSSQH